MDYSTYLAGIASRAAAGAAEQTTNKQQTAAKEQKNEMKVRTSLDKEETRFGSGLIFKFSKE
jgi:hypothetical protein